MAIRKHCEPVRVPPKGDLSPIPYVRFPPNPAVRVANKEQDRYGGSTVWRVVRLGRQSRKDLPSGFGREQGLIATRFQPCSLFPLATVGLWRRVRFPPIAATSSLEAAFDPIRTLVGSEGGPIT